MRIIDNVTEMMKTAKHQDARGGSIGFVPTMGYLHEGHISLMNMSKSRTDVTVVSIFVNPTQFGPNEDFESYPRDAAGDIAICKAAGVDILFTPSPADMYPYGYATYVDVQSVTDGLCGANRPGHFRGVATVVSKLFNIVRPHKAFFGQKDYQQTVVIRRMTENLNFGIDIVVVPTLREVDGVAMSSRNVYLSPEERAVAPTIFRALTAAQEMKASGVHDATAIFDATAGIIRQEPLMDIEYLSIVDADTLEPVSHVEKEAVIAVAVKLGRTRLIDNMIL